MRQNLARSVPGALCEYVRHVEMRVYVASALSVGETHSSCVGFRLLSHVFEINHDHRHRLLDICRAPIAARGAASGAASGCTLMRTTLRRQSVVKE